MADPTPTPPAEPAEPPQNSGGWVPDVDAALAELAPYLPDNRLPAPVPPAQVGRALLRTPAAPAPAGDHRFDTSYDILLDDEPDSGAPAAVPVDLPDRDTPPVDGERRPVIPPGLRGPNLRPTLVHYAGHAAHVAAFHTVRLPWYALRTTWWAFVGLARLADAQRRWWWVSETAPLRRAAVEAADPATWLKLHRELRATRARRGIVLAAEATALACLLLVGLPTAAETLPWPVTAAASLAAAVGLARFGRPTGQPLISPAVVTPRFRRLSADIVLRAYYAAKLGDPAKPGQQVTFGSPMSRDGGGSRVLVDLPYGKGLSDAARAKDAIASGLDVATSQVFITRDPTSHRRHVLWVADRDPLALPAGRSPLLACKPTDIWAPAPFGLDERGRRVNVELMWNSILVGAQPRQGKTFALRSLALHATLDPHVKISVFDGGGKPDWRGFALIADRCAFGLAMTRDGDPVEILIHTLREIKSDVQDRYVRLSDLPAQVCPEGKLTRTIARDPRFGMPVRMLVLDEFQEYFNTGDPAADKEIADLLVYLVRVAPAAGVILADATQRPSGIGSGGEVAKKFTDFRDNHLVRFALRTGSFQVSDLVLGAGAYSEGLDSSTLLPQYKGVGILRGTADEAPTVRTYLADAQDADKILRVGRALREHAGTLTGHAAGQPMPREARDVLADVAAVFAPGEAGLHWQEIAARLAVRMPEHYADVTADAVSAQLRDLGVPSANVKRDGQVLRGARAAAVTAAADRRNGDHNAAGR